ncbi:protein-glutamate O-methyltransferase CheR [Acidocella sp.]|uniref:CheR family methyltransferase n=1 Tax=Acidocella sp. TaxID=50710 RepID=UPI00262A8496|nr:protein-glutamate O-methyltransferase CheR [Acidocella sp.]
MASFPAVLAGGQTDQAEFTLAPSELDTIAGIVKREAGISLTQAKANLVYARLARRIRALGLTGFSEYCALVSAPEGEAERWEMVAALTTNVTRFFREPHHFEHMRAKLLPDLILHARAGGRVRLWSAACSSGPEPYSMALTILRDMSDAPRHDVKILATDIDPNVLAAAAAGIYDEAALAPVPAALRQAWFEKLPNGAGWRAGKELRRLVSFRQLNLIGAWPMKGTFQAIFCRNVVIYFDASTQERVWSRFMPLLAPGGALYIGHSERVTGDAARFVETDGVTIYRRFNQVRTQ